MIKKLIELLKQQNIGCGPEWCENIELDCMDCPFDTGNFDNLIKELEQAVK